MYTPSTWQRLRLLLVSTLTLVSAGAAYTSDVRLQKTLPDSAFASNPDGSFSSTSTYSSSGSSWHVTWSESSVFKHRIQHQDANLKRSWDVRLGRGGQIYSLRGYFGEAIPPQYRSHGSGPPGHETEISAWNDEVFQTVAVNLSLQNTYEPQGFAYFMHGSGPYLNDNTYLTEPWYNPSLIDGSGDETRTYVTVNWMNQAHVPTIHKSHAISYLKYRDVGKGIIEVTAGIYNFGDAALDFFNFPWGGVRSTTFGTYHFRANGADVNDTSTLWAAGFPLNTTDGWLLFTNGTGGSGAAVGLVYGQDKNPRPYYQSSQSVFRYGFAGGGSAPPPGASETEWRNYQVSSMVRRFDVPVGTGAWARYYILVGDRDDVKSRIASESLLSKADYGLINITEAEADLISWYGDEDGPLSTSSTAGALRFKLYAQPVGGSVPLFKVETATGEHFVTPNPYLLTEPYVENGHAILRPYDGKTARWELMGYGIPGGLSSAPPAGHNYLWLSNILTPAVFLADGVNVQVLRPDVPPAVWSRIEVQAHSTWLSSANGSVEMAPSSTTGLSTQWRFAVTPDGYYKIVNRAGNEKLRAVSSTSVSMVADPGGTVPDSDKWKLVFVDGDYSRFRIESKLYGRWLIGYPAPGNGVALDLTSKTGTWTRWKIFDVN